MGSATGLYLYAIGYASQLRQLDDTEPLTGIHDSAVRTLECGELAAVVSDSPYEHYDLTREHLLAHQRVLEALLSLSDILPVAYGTVASGISDVVDNFLEPNAGDFLLNLDYIQGRIELNLRVYWNQELLLQEILAEYDDIRALQAQIGNTPESASYYERIRLGELTVAAIEQKTQWEQDAILNALDALAVEIALGDASDERLIVNVACLVEREHEAAFDETVQVLARKRGDRMRFRYVGPLPPASFGSIRIGQDGAT